jgi:hypothetical protein
MATKLLLQAVFIVMLGPLRLKKKLIRFDKMAPPVPTAWYFGLKSLSRFKIPS